MIQDHLQRSFSNQTSHSLSSIRWLERDYWLSVERTLLSKRETTVQDNSSSLTHPLKLSNCTPTSKTQLPLRTQVNQETWLLTRPMELGTKISDSMATSLSTREDSKSMYKTQKTLMDKTSLSGRRLEGWTNNGRSNTSTSTLSKTESSLIRYSRSSPRWMEPEQSLAPETMSLSETTRRMTKTNYSSLTLSQEASSQSRTTTSHWKLVMQAEADTLNSTRKEISGSSTSSSRERTLSTREASYSKSLAEETRTTRTF